MPARILDGKTLAAAIRARLRAEAARLAQPPELACLWAGSDPAAASYRKGLAKACAEAGVRLVERALPASADGAMLLAGLEELTRDPDVSGILLQAPLPAGVDAGRLVALLDPCKDAEGISPASLGRALKGEEAQAPCTARAAVALVKASSLDLKGAEAVVVGRSAIVGKPAALLLADAGATVTLCRSTTRALASHTRRADVLVVAVGKPGIVTGDMIKPGAVVIDVGINLVEGRLLGDVDFPSASRSAGWLTPVPGGVGPVTVAMLLERCVAAALARHALARR